MRISNPFSYKYIAKKEIIQGDYYYVIYARWMFIDTFLCVFNSEESCKKRLNELRDSKNNVFEINL